MTNEEQNRLQAMMNTMAQQRNAAMDAVVERDGIIADLKAKLQSLTEELEKAKSNVESTDTPAV